MATIYYACYGTAPDFKSTCPAKDGYYLDKKEAMKVIKSIHVAPGSKRYVLSFHYPDEYIRASVDSIAEDLESFYWDEYIGDD